MLTNSFKKEKNLVIPLEELSKKLRENSLKKDTHQENSKNPPTDKLENDLVIITDCLCGGLNYLKCLITS